MTITQALVPSTQMMVNIEEMAQLGTQAVFKARPVVMTQNILGQMERRDRIVLLLLDGNRTLQEVSRLIHRSELEIAYILVRLLKRGFIEFLGAQTRSRNGLR